MKFTIDKTKFPIFISAVVFAIIGVVILHNIRPSITVDARIHSEQVNFDLKKLDNPQPFCFPNSNLWILRAKIQEFKTIMFKASPEIENSKLINFCDGRKFLITPISNTGYAVIKSQKGTFSLNEIFFEADIAVSWKGNGIFHNIAIKNITETDSLDISSEFSIGDTLSLTLYNCAFRDSNERILYKTNPNKLERFTIPISFANPHVLARAKNNKLDIEIEVEVDAFTEDIEILKDLQIKNLNFLQQKYDAAGKIKEKNCLLNSSFKRARYSADDSVVIRKGDFIKSRPDNTFLKFLKIEAKALMLQLQYRNVSSFKVGPRADAEQELVKSLLDILRANELLIIIYSIAVIIFGVLTNLIVKKKQTPT